MSQETMEWLNKYILVGNCKARPNAWHNRPEFREANGLEENHFQDPIPYRVVVDRLFNWKAISAPKANLIPVPKRDANWFDADGNPFKIVMSSEYDYKKREIIGGEQGIVKSDTLEHIATHSGKYKIHDYEQWLLQLQSNVIGDTLSILGAGLLRNGAQAYVQVALPETVQDNNSGMEFVPYIMGSTSLDGSIPSTYSAGSLLVVCDNTRDGAIAQANQSGRIYKAKHTSKSLDTDSIKDVQQALGIVHQTAESMKHEFAELAAIDMNRRQTLKVLDIIQPIPKEKDGATKRQVVIAENKREGLLHAIFRDPTGGAEWKNTALGLSNGVSTYFTWNTSVKGNRLERNAEKAIKAGVERRKALELGAIESGATFRDVDRQTMMAIAHVMNRPELVGK
ncbi:hypothetical protein HWC80_gp050 [Mycobacterium phage Indlulamithi]|uniref:DUF932 domain-containing protein n=1 Tax=Mycobacterium phage Indlulamithi TaxID=2656582 RepID=A0A649VCL0_9CAUD|nr:hypothetical protein HWC80_gp050 [Mycobacterium phage Indlulamithi]QGJ90090.1 hypothetical protein PBI_INDLULAMITHI_50 [Mycobacterium phage Indlulamithi]